MACDEILACIEAGHSDDIRNGLLSATSAGIVTMGTALIASTPMGWSLVGITAIAAALAFVGTEISDNAPTYAISSDDSSPPEYSPAGHTLGDVMDGINSGKFDTSLLLMWAGLGDQEQAIFVNNIMSLNAGERWSLRSVFSEFTYDDGLIKSQYQELVGLIIQDETLLRLLVQSAEAYSPNNPDGEFFDTVGSSPEILEELVGSPILSLMLFDLLGSDSVQGLLANTFFNTTGGDILFDQAVQAAVNRALGVEEGEAVFGEDGENPEGMELDADGKPINPLEQMRDEIMSLIQGLKGEIGGIQRNSARISAIEEKMNHLATSTILNRDLSSGYLPPPEPGQDG